MCLDWRIGRIAWNVNGPTLFANGDVPNLAHDSGTHSRRCAEVLRAWCDERAAAGELPETITLVEYGMGTGLFMRLLLDAFKSLCADAELDYYDRLQVYATDVSSMMLQSAADRGMFAAHEEHVTLALADMLAPGKVRAIDAAEHLEITGKVDAAFANYALDLLPIDIFRRAPLSAAAGDNGSEPKRPWEVVMVRTWLRNTDQLAAHTDLGLDAIKELAAKADPTSVSQLGPIYSLLQMELRTFPIDITIHPDADALVRYAEDLENRLGDDHDLLRDGTVVYHSRGAIEAAERIAEQLQANGLLLVRDVGLHTAELAAVPRTYQHFGPTVAAAVNTIEFDAHFAHEPRSGARAIGPGVDGVRNQVVRLLAKGTCRIDDAFQAAFDGAQDQETDALLNTARTTESASEAVEIYRQVLVREPGNWALMEETSRRIVSDGLDPRMALVIATRGLSINTEHSAGLWAVYADALWAAGDRTSARAAYQTALAVNDRHARSHYGLAFVEAEDGRFDSAFKHVGEALACDPDGALRAEVLRLLDVCLRGQRTAREGFWARMNDRASR